MSQSLFSQPLNVINVGIAMFSDDLKKQHVEVTQLDWTPPGQGNMQVVQALDNIADSPPLTSRRWSVLSSRIRC
jgi:hypothetical protein